MLQDQKVAILAGHLFDRGQFLEAAVLGSRPWPSIDTCKRCFDNIKSPSISVLHLQELEGLISQSCMG